MRVTPQRLTKPGTAALSDALGKTGAMQHDLQCYSANPVMAGPAFTLRVHTADILMVTPALRECPRGYVLVIDGRGERNTALWGELTTYCAEHKTLAGVVIDGAIRDARAIAASKLPVFARAKVPNAGGGEYPGEIGVAVNCAGQVVNPGDWIVGDHDGVIVIQAARAEAALARAEQIVAAEKKIEKAVRAGRSLADLLEIDAVLARKGSTVAIPQLREQKR
ncbi:MAG: RraA family protein [Acidobacteria bacterium]|nr:RraA family protein [Acidobacteriota bacterium]